MWQRLLHFLFATLLFCLTGEFLLAAEGGEETRTFIAYSMRQAEAEIKASTDKGSHFRSNVELNLLGGITKPKAIFVDPTTMDIILMGQADTNMSPLTLDDWVVALRTRYYCPNVDPGVTIDPFDKKSNRPLSNRKSFYATEQKVSFFGLVDNTHFGKVCFDADWLLKRISIGLDTVPIPGFKSEFSMFVQGWKTQGTSSMMMSSRMWFLPTACDLISVNDTAYLEDVKMGVFAESEYGEIDGKEVPGFVDRQAEAFAQSFTDNYKSIAKYREVLRTLEGLTRLAALAKGALKSADFSSNAFYFLKTYSVDRVNIEHFVDVIGVTDASVKARMNGGVTLAALDFGSSGSDITSLRSSVFQSRPDPAALTWPVLLHTLRGHIIGINVAGASRSDQLFQLFSHAAFLEEKARYSDSVALLTQIIETTTNDAMLYNTRGYVYVDEKHFKEALSDFKIEVRLDPNDPAGYNGCGIAREALGDFEGAIADCSKAIELNPDTAGAWGNRGQAKEAKGDFVGAIVDCTKAIQLMPTDGNAYYNRGIVRHLAGDLEGAITDYSKAIELKPDFGAAYVNRSSAKQDLGDLDGSMDDATRAIQLVPDFEDAYIGRGIAKFNRWDLAGAIADFSEALKINPDNAVPYTDRSAARERNGDLDGAIADCTKAIQIDRAQANAYFNRGLANQSEDRLDLAVADYTRVIQLRPDNALAYYYRGRAQGAKSDLDAAISDFTKIIQLDPGFSDAYGFRARARAIKGDSAGAIADYQTQSKLKTKSSVGNVTQNTGAITAPQLHFLHHEPYFNSQ